MNQPAQTCTPAIVSLVLGILAWVALPFIGALGAVLAGHMALSEIREIRANRGDISGEGLAVAGLVLGWIQLGIFLLGIAVVMIAIALGKLA